MERNGIIIKDEDTAVSELNQLVDLVNEVQSDIIKFGDAVETMIPFVGNNLGNVTALLASMQQEMAEAAEKVQEAKKIFEKHVEEVHEVENENITI